MLHVTLLFPAVYKSNMVYLCRERMAAREKADATLAAAQMQSLQYQEQLRESQKQLAMTREQLHACQAKVENLEHQLQDSQDHLHQAAAELQVSCEGMQLVPA